MEPMVRTVSLIGSLLLALFAAMPAAADESLLYETWLTSTLDPHKLDRFIQAHEAQYTEGYFHCSQEAQRLIRDEADRGVLMICDTRLVDKPYGKRIWQSLPPMRRTRALSEVTAFFDTAEQAAPAG